LLGARDRLTQREDDEDGEEGASTKSTEKSRLEFQAGANPIPVLRQYFLESETEPLKMVQEVQEATSKMGWSETQTQKAIFAALFDPDIKTNFYKKCDILALFVKNTRHEKIVLACVEKIVLGKGGALVRDLPNILHGFYEEAIVSEDTINKWYEYISKGADAKGSDAKALQEKKNFKSLKDNCTTFVEWLKTAESEDEDEFY